MKTKEFKINESSMGLITTIGGKTIVAPTKELLIKSAKEALYFEFNISAVSLTVSNNYLIAECNQNSCHG